MISWGTRYDPIGEYVSLVSEDCRICSDKNKPVYKAEQAYFKLYGMGIFPLGKTYYKTCTACNTRLKTKLTDKNLREVKNALPGQFKFKYVWGWIILAPIIFGAIYLFMSIQK